MKVFLNWSGPTSQAVAASLREWLPLVIQSVDPFMSQEDIEKGSRWFTEISTVLDECDFGIVCLTPDNLTAPWIHFEAGAIAKRLDKGRVSPFLVGVKTSDVPNPLGLFQATAFKKNELWRLVRSINTASGDGLPDDRLSRSFEMFWPQFEREVSGIVTSLGSPPATEPVRTERELLEELVDLVRSQARLLATPSTPYTFVATGTYPMETAQYVSSPESLTTWTNLETALSSRGGGRVRRRSSPPGAVSDLDKAKRAALTADVRALLQDEKADVRFEPDRVLVRLTRGASLTDLAPIQELEEKWKVRIVAESDET